jgi:hypothetical protein
VTSGARSLQHMQENPKSKHRAVGTLRCRTGWQANQDKRVSKQLRVLLRCSLLCRNACMHAAHPTKMLQSSVLGRTRPVTAQHRGREAAGPTSQNVHACRCGKHASLLRGLVGQWQASAGPGSCSMRSHAVVIPHPCALPALYMQRAGQQRQQHHRHSQCSRTGGRRSAGRAGLCMHGGVGAGHTQTLSTCAVWGPIYCPRNASRHGSNGMHAITPNAYA